MQGWKWSLHYPMWMSSKCKCNQSTHNHSTEEGKDATAVLVKILGGDTDARVRRRAAAGIGKLLGQNISEDIKMKAIKELCIREMSGDAEDLYVAVGLRDLGANEPEQVAVLLKLLENHPNEEVKREAGKALEYF